MARKKKWIQAARERMERKGTVGSLRRIAGVKKGEKIPLKKLEQLAHSQNPKTRKKAQFALNVRKYAGKGGRAKKRK